MDRGAWWATVHGAKETEHARARARTHTHTHTHTYTHTHTHTMLQREKMIERSPLNNSEETFEKVVSGRWKAGKQRLKRQSLGSTDE